VPTTLRPLVGTLRLDAGRLVALSRHLDRAGTGQVATAAVQVAPMIRFLLKLIIIDLAALIVIGATVLLIAAAWQFLTGGAL
jgi:hypothetical protein